MAKHGDPGEAIISAKVSAELVTQAEVLGQGNRSVGVRMLCELGLAALHSDLDQRLELHQLIIELQAIAQQFPGGRTSSLAYALPGDVSLPPELHEGRPYVAACPGIVRLVSDDHDIAFSIERSGSCWLSAGGFRRQLSTAKVMTLALHISTALYKFTSEKPGTAAVCAGLLRITKHQDTFSIAIEDSDVIIGGLPPLVPYQLLSELQALLCQSLATGAKARQQLEATLAIKQS